MRFALPIICWLAVLAGVACLTFGSKAAKPAATVPEEKPLEAFQAPFVETISFGYWKGEPFTSNWVETRKVPFRTGRYFGWRMKLREPHTKYANIIERFLTPRPTTNWGLLENRHLVSSDRQVATVPNTLKVRDHWIQRANWSLSEGDPLGLHTIEVQINGRLAARIIFEVVADTNPEPQEEEPAEDEIEGMDETPAPNATPTPEPADPTAQEPAAEDEP